MNDGPALRVENLRTSFFTRSGEIPAVNDVNFHVGRGEILGLVGESGSGKSVTGLSILGLIDEPGRIVGGRVVLDGVDLLQLQEEQLRRLRGRKLAMIFQDPMTTLNPLLRIGTQITEALRAHERVSAREAFSRAVEALGQVGIPSPQERMDSYPHQFSGGMRQRVGIAIAMLHHPTLIIADEPTTALDVTIQAQILSEMQTLCRQRRTALIWITHDLSVVAGLADRVCVMYAGRIVEEGSVDDVLDRPLHPYTDGLIRSVPGQTPRGHRLHQISGNTPSLLSLPPGCSFQQRCRRADEQCQSEPALSVRYGRQAVRCFHPGPNGGL